jgi:hypothetical protein
MLLGTVHPSFSYELEEEDVTLDTVLDRHAQALNR